VAPRDLNTDSLAVKTRAAINASLAKADLEEWVFTHAGFSDGMSILDLGCGLGKQTFYLAGRLSPTTSILALDISEEAVEAVNRTARERGLAGVEARVLGLDECAAALVGQKFQRIISVYAIYYSSDMPGVLRSLAGLLDRGGRLFVCGPGASTNREIIDLANRHIDDPGSRLPDIDDFISREQIASLVPVFGGCHTVRLANAIRFPDADTALTWWREHASYRPQAEAGVRGDLEGIVARHGEFVLTKNVLGVRLDV
jgi:SAM-dependent methyltransferase